MARRFHGRALPRRGASRQGASPLQHFPAASTVTSPAASPVASRRPSPAASRRPSRRLPGDFPGDHPRRLPRGASRRPSPAASPAASPGGFLGDFPVASPATSLVGFPVGFPATSLVGFPVGFPAASPVASPKGASCRYASPRRGALPGAFTEGIRRTYVLETSTARRPCRGKKHGATLFAKPHVFMISVCLYAQCRAARAIFSIIRSS